jgi:hypothetical protein
MPNPHGACARNGLEALRLGRACPERWNRGGDVMLEVEVEVR